MKFNKSFFCAAACGVAMLAFSSSANAQYTGRAWQVSNSTAANASPSSIPGGSPLATFSLSALNFSSYGNIGNTGNPSADYTLGSFISSLGSGTYTGPGATTALDAGGMGFLFQFTGTASFTTGQTFTLAHDDGATLIVNGMTVLSQPGPTSPVTTTYTYTGPSGNQSFNFIYGECCGAPAVFETTLVPATTTPEPTSIVLLASAFVGAGALYRRRRKAA